MKSKVVKVKIDNVADPRDEQYVDQIATATPLSGGYISVRFEDGKELIIGKDQYTIVEGKASDLKDRVYYAPRSSSGAQDRRINRANRSMMKHFRRGTGPRY